jgi:hypothetical protein
MLFQYVESLNTVISISDRDHNSLRFDTYAVFADGLIIDIYVGF